MPSERPGAPRRGWDSHSPKRRIPAAGMRPPPHNAPGIIPGTCTPPSHPPDGVQTFTTFFRTLPTLPLVGSGQSPSREGAGSTAEDELAGSQSRPARFTG